MRNIYTILFVITSLLFIVFRFPYRTFIYRYDLFDFYIADTSPNFLAVLMFVFFKKRQKNKHNNFQICFFSFVGLVIYEFFIQIHIYPGATIDLLDVISSLLASVISYFICNYFDSKIVIHKK